jgi:hypothetical protein
VSGTVALGHALVVTGVVVTYVSFAFDLATRGARTTRAVGRVVLAVGRVVLAVAGWVVHPLVALHRWLGESPTARCARRGHRRTWDGLHEWCERCGIERRALEQVRDEFGRLRYRDEPWRW